MRALFSSSIFWLILTFTTAVPALAQEDAPVVHATPAMWTVHGPKGTAYLLGSVHALPDNIEWQTPQIKAAMKRPGTFVFEIPMQLDDHARTERLLGENMLLPIGMALPSFFDKEMRGQWNAAILHTQVQPEVMMHLRPWWAAKILAGAMSGRVTLFADQGVDNKVADYARQRGARFRALETAELQLNMLMGGATPENELALLRAAIKKASNMSMVPFQKLLTAWEKGDVAGLKAVSWQTMSAAERKVILDDRNSAWVPQIKKMLDEKRIFFITVGAAHMVGPLGVPEQLRAAGYRVDGP